MLERKKKKCKGTGKAKGNGCGNEEYIHKYGLCKSCFINWCFDTPEGKEWYGKARKIQSKKIEREKRREVIEAKKKIKTKSQWERQLQGKINEIVRLIDFDKGCISCEHGWTDLWTRQRHAGHRWSRGAYPELKFNLFNEFTQCSVCNNFLSGNETEYDKGLIKHYGNEMYQKVMELSENTKPLKLTIEDIQDKITIANEILREIKSGKDYTREEINSKLNIYEKRNKV